ncbi:hypothetical protein BDE02_17G101500 [Populus trichocarpa]|nr:hypothetical protein BDE02_17G101500 [Populus trichocarpa]
MTFFIRFPEEKVEELLHNHLHPLSADRAFYATLRGWRSGCRLGSDGLLPSSLKFESASRCETMDCMLCASITTRTVRTLERFIW